MFRCILVKLIWLASELFPWNSSVYQREHPGLCPYIAFPHSLQGPWPVGFLSSGRAQVASEAAVQWCSWANESVEKESREFRFLCKVHFIALWLAQWVLLI